MKPIHALFAVAIAFVWTPLAEAQAALPQSLAKRIDAVFATSSKPGSPGCALAVMHKGSVVYKKGYGLASLEHRRPILPGKTVFNIASASKQFTAASILLLVQAKKLALDDDIRKFVPELPDYGHRITVRHLLHHTSGLRDYYTLLELAFVSSVDHTTPAQTLATITRQRSLDFIPGSEWSYTSAGYFLLGQIVQRVSGQSLRDFAQDRIFGPLGMRHTQFLERYDQIIDDVATGYKELPDGGFAVDMSNWMTAGPSGLRTTVEDLAKWDQNFYTGAVGGTWLVEELQRPGQLNSGEAIEYARGLMVDEYRGLKVVSHDGSFAGYGAELFRLPSERFSVAVLCNNNSAWPNQLVKEVTDVYFGAKLRKKTAPPADVAAQGSESASPSIDLTQFRGIFWDRKRTSVRRIEVRDNKLFFVRSSNNASELAVIDRNRLQMKGTPRPTQLVLSTDSSGKRSLRVVTSGVGVIHGATSEFIEVQPFATGEKLANYTGTFYSDELDVRWKLAIVQDRLILRDPRGFDMALQPEFADTWSYDGSLVRYHRDANKQIIGFFVDAGRARNLKFVKGSDSIVATGNTSK